MKPLAITARIIAAVLAIPVGAWVLTECTAWLLKLPLEAWADTFQWTKH